VLCMTRLGIGGIIAKHSNNVERQAGSGSVKTAKKKVPRAHYFMPRPQSQIRQRDNRKNSWCEIFS
jgi:hypothetical protein